MGASTSRGVDVVVVGAGISGMRLARITADRYKWHTVLVEKLPAVGGRVSHVRDSKDDVGAYRILKHHDRTLKLVKNLGLVVETLFDTTENDRPRPKDCLTDERKMDDLNKWQQRAEACGHDHANRMDEYSGYDGASHFQSSRTAKGRVRGDYSMVVRGGMHAIADRMKQKLVDETPLCKILLQHRVADIVQAEGGGYTVTCTNRDGVRITLCTPRVILACPPHHVKHLSIVRDWAQPLLHSLVGQARMRIYATVVDADDLVGDVRGKRLITDTMLRQTIIPPTGNRIQVSYASGKFAEFWSGMFMQSREAAVHRLQVELQKALKTDRKVTLTDVAEKYWPDGITSWKGGRGTLVDPCAIYHLHKTMCPNVVWAGDAVAPSKNGWINSALVSVGYAVFTLRDKLNPMLPTFPSLEDIPEDFCDGKYAVLQGRVLNMTTWIDRHPGGKKPITNHLREDITALWLMYHQHSAFAWAQVLPLQCGWIARDS